jgi:hypothetical protein
VRSVTASPIAADAGELPAARCHPRAASGLRLRPGSDGQADVLLQERARRTGEARSNGVVYDVVNDHFSGPHAADYHGMCAVADVITCASPVMAEIIKEATGRDATVVDDPYENDESRPRSLGDQVVWFGHQANFASLAPYADLDPWVCTGDGVVVGAGSASTEAAAVVMLTGNNPGASANRAVKALRAGRFVVCPARQPGSRGKTCRTTSGSAMCAKASPGHLNNREEACQEDRSGPAIHAGEIFPERDRRSGWKYSPRHWMRRQENRGLARR